MERSEIVRRGDLLHEIRRLLGEGATLAAVDAGERALKRFPDDPEIAHATILAIGRAGGRRKARDLLKTLGCNGEGRNAIYGITAHYAAWQGDTHG